MKLSSCCGAEARLNNKGIMKCFNCHKPCTEQPEPAEWEKEVYRLMDSFLTEAKDQFGRDRSLERLNADRHLFVGKMMDLIAKAKKEGAEEERERIKKNIPLLRQWINEKPKDLLITNDQLEKFLIN